MYKSGPRVYANGTLLKPSRYNTGWFTTPFGVVHYDSGAELKYLQSLDFSLLRKFVKGYAIPYKLPMRTRIKDCVFFVDFFLEYKNGRQKLVEVKGKHLLAQKQTQVKLNAAALYCFQRGIAWEVILA